MRNSKGTHSRPDRRGESKTNEADSTIRRTTSLPRIKEMKIKSLESEKQKMKALKKLWEAIISPFVAIEVLLDESRRENLDGEWDGYWARKNRKEERRASKGESKC